MLDVVAVVLRLPVSVRNVRTETETWRVNSVDVNSMAVVDTRVNVAESSVPAVLEIIPRERPASRMDRTRRRERSRRSRLLRTRSSNSRKELLPTELRPKSHGNLQMDPRRRRMSRRLLLPPRPGMLPRSAPRDNRDQKETMVTGKVVRVNVTHEVGSVGVEDSADVEVIMDSTQMVTITGTETPTFSNRLSSLCRFRMDTRDSITPAEALGELADNKLVRMRRMVGTTVSRNSSFIRSSLEDMISSVSL